MSYFLSRFVNFLACTPSIYKRISIKPTNYNFASSSCGIEYLSLYHKIATFYKIPGMQTRKYIYLILGIILVAFGIFSTYIQADDLKRRFTAASFDFEYLL